MTAILLQRSRHPVLCMCCSRMAVGLGVYEGPNKPVVAWVCNDRTCTACTGALITMKSNELTELEHRACHKVARAMAASMVETVMSAIWDAGVRDLTQATPEQVAAAEGALVHATASERAPLAKQVEAVVVGFGDAVKKDLKDGVCSF